MNNIAVTQASGKESTYFSEKNLPQHLICFSHLRWDFVYQRPQHLLSRMAKDLTVTVIEEPVFDATHAHFSHTIKEAGVTVMVPHLPAGNTHEENNELLNRLLEELFYQRDLSEYIFWYYTPMALEFSASFRPGLIVFDVMDELSAFKFAPQKLKDLENELLQRADVVFTGGNSLYHAKKDRHHNIHLFPSSIDKTHFGKARNISTDPADQKNIAHPRFGFFGVIDERFDIDLIDEVSSARPDWQFILIGPVVKIDPATLPQRHNIHYLGGKSYAELPDYLSGWDVAMVSFALNESTRFISPTKTPEYLSAGVPVISTPIHDVVEQYGHTRLVHIAADATEFISAGQKILADQDKPQWLERVDDFLQHISWDNTADEMKNLLGKAFTNKKETNN